MYYQINVSKNGYHVLATAPESAPYEHDAKKLYKLLKKKFPLEEGYRIDVTFYTTTGQPVDFDDEIEYLKTPRGTFGNVKLYDSQYDLRSAGFGLYFTLIGPDVYTNKILNIYTKNEVIDGIPQITDVAVLRKEWKEYKK